MTLLQRLIQSKIDEGKSYREIGAESGVNYSSVANYHRNPVEPTGKNLGLLANYFGVHYSLLVEDYLPSEWAMSPIKKEMFDTLISASDAEVQAALVLLRRQKRQG